MNLNKKNISQLIEKMDFEYKSCIIMFFDEIEKFLSIRRNKEKVENLIMERTLEIFEELDELFKIGKDLFNVNDESLYKIIIKGYFDDKKKLSDYISDLTKNTLNHLKIKDYYLNNMITKFFEGLNKLKDFYIIEYKEYSNINFKVFKWNSRHLKHRMMKDIIINLSPENIITIYRLQCLSQKQIKESTRFELEQLINKLEKINGMIIKMQNLTKQNELIVLDINKNISMYVKACNMILLDLIYFNNIEESSLIELLTFNVRYERNIFTISIKQINLKLYYYLYLDKKQIFKERLFKDNDIVRALCFIKEYGNRKCNIKINKIAYLNELYEME